MEDQRNENATTADEPVLEIRLFGTFQVKSQQQAVAGFRSDKTRALLAYLVVEAGVAHRRDALTALLWSEYDDRAARRSLSSALTNLRQLLAPSASAETEALAIASDRSDVIFEFDLEYAWIDVIRFDNLIQACESHSHRALVHCGACISRLEQAAALYRGEFLAGLSLPDSTAFEEWRVQRAEGYYQRVTDTLWVLAQHHLETGAFRPAEEFARRHLALTPWSEPAHRQVMMALAASGQRAAALAQYEQCRQVLKNELHIDPDPLTIQLAERIQTGFDATAEALASVAQESPYKGLRAFRDADAVDFYGRERLTAQLVARVSRRSLVTVIGPSGSGKTSLIQAGLVHDLRSKDMALVPEAQASRRDARSAGSWLIAEMRPGSRPFDALAASLTRLFPSRKSGAQSAAFTEAGLAQGLRDRSVALSQLVDLATPAADGGTPSRLLLIVDQFEEMFALCPDAATCVQFAETLIEAAQAHETTGRLTVLLAIRADFMGQVLAIRELANQIQDGTIVIGPMNLPELEQAILLPAQACGVRFQEGLVNRVMNDVGSAPGQLPLLEFALTQLWEQRSGSLLTHTAYEAAGRVEGALAWYAEEVYAAFDEVEQRQVQRVFMAMVRPGQDTQDTRRPVSRSELGEAQWTLVQKLADTRLVVTNRDENDQETAEIVHETLIQGWSRLKQWMDADRAFQVWQQRMRAAVAQWEQSGRDEGALLRGATLAEAEGWMASRTEDIASSVGDYVRVSQAVRDREHVAQEAAHRREIEQAQALAQAEHLRAEAEGRSRKRLRRLAFGLGLVSFLAVAAGLLALGQTRQSERLATVAVNAQATAEAERAGAEHQAQRALSRQLAAQAVTYSGVQPDLSVLLSQEALRLSEIAGDRKDSLLTLEVNPLLASFLAGQEGAVYAIAVSPDGRLLATSNDTGDIRLWDLASRQPLGQAIEGLGREARALSFSSDGAVLAAGDDLGNLRFFDVANQQLRGQPIAAHEKPILGLRFSPDGSSVRTVSEDGTTRLWGVDSGQPIGDPLVLAGETAMALSPDLDLVASKSGVTITVQSLPDGEVVGEPMIGHVESIQNMTFSPDARMLASSSFDKSSIIWDLASSRSVHPPLSNGNARALVSAFSPDGSKLAAAGTDGTVTLWDVGTGQPILPRLKGNSNWMRSLAFTPDGTTLIAGSADGSLALWDLTRHRRLTAHTGPVRGVAFSGDGKLLATGSYDRTARVWNVATGEPVTPPMEGHENSIVDVDIDPAGTMVATGIIRGKVTFFDARTGAQLYPQQTGHDEGILAVRFSPDGKHLATGGFGNDIRFWDTASGKPLDPLMEGHSNWVLGFAFSPDGKILSSASADTTVRLWDVATRQPIGEPLEGHTGWVGSVAFSPDGKTLVSGSHDLTLRFWDVATGQPIGEPLTGHHAPIWYVAFDPSDDGKTLVSVDGSGTLIRWDVATRQPLGPPMMTELETEGIDLSPDGRTLAVGAFDNSGQIHLWTVDKGAWTDRSCVIANRPLSKDEWQTFMGELPYEPSCQS